MEHKTSNNFEESVRNLIEEIEQREKDGILETANALVLKKLIRKAETTEEASIIASLGTTYKKTGFHFDKRLEKHQLGNKIRFFKRKSEKCFGQAKEGEPIHKLIIGDNYYALQNLLIQYKNGIDVIYIDPPYGKDNMGEFAKTTYNNAISRDNLLSMLYFRLQIAKRLLKEDGIIFCSIDDRNQAYVKCLFDEVFYEKNSCGMLLWQKKDKPSFLSKTFGSRFEYVLCYCKDIKMAFPFTLESTTIGKKYPINNAGNSLGILKFKAGSVSFNLPDGIVEKQDMSEGNIKTTLLNDVVIENGKNKNEFKLEGEFRYNQKTLDEVIENNEPITIANIPFRPNHVKNGGEPKKMENILSKKFRYNCETNEDATEQEIDILGSICFENPKPVGLIELLLKATTYDKKDATVLDFFAGSGTTGHAVLDLNKDGGNRTFILCQMNEEHNEIAYEVTCKRLKRIMTGECYDGSKDFKWTKENEPYGGQLEVYEIDEVDNNCTDEGKTPFDVIDETLYGQKKFTSLRDKIAWVCSNFEQTQMNYPKSEKV
ncbi:MAG: site-specific DNA-methyltransferase [Aeriscardovia sp.]|nr:site-specific DNA-methyltransferase [Aeriscardovia sp.]